MPKFTAKMSRAQRIKKMRNEMDFWKREQLPNGRYHSVSTSMKEIDEAELIQSICTDLWSWMFWYGVSSEFPLCCVIFYCDVWHDWLKEKKMFCNNESGDWSQHLGYILCPNCQVTCMCVRNPEKEKVLKRGI